ncbi:hypothetical protein BD311DRAFT_761861 [Dichomitus squalens]|uniref:Uncharacterized protein n=1 Tax=Dichomitus squalens TaxID=114155 RepID=A0A4Q9ML16_9APHY|nr:hypothetical protein BD311DRAFT_761861 [Dichomitus squalens]
MSYDNTQRRPNTSPPPEGHQATTGSMNLNNDGLNRPTTDFIPVPPSETVQPTQVTTPTQQAATQPSSGGVAQKVVIQDNEPSFNQKVVGYAKEIRGTILRKPETKDSGGKIRKGEEPWPPQPAGQNDAGSDTTSPA